ncbi:hypothetical protein F5Y10DRAFT_272195 [Nemania abortiva]|nr:hypothetical protein F5Y10DRAFT_272195 [Nemania abortiva]
MAETTMKMPALSASDTPVGIPSKLDSKMPSGDSQSRPPQGEDGSQYVTGFKLVIIIASVSLACFLMLIDTMVISTAIPRITDEFNSLASVGWYASAYQFGR